MAVARRNTQRGTMASVLLDDKTGRIEATLFNEAFEQYRDLLSVDRVLVIEGSLINDEYRGGKSLRADRVLAFEDCRAERVGLLTLSFAHTLLEQHQWSAALFTERLAKLLQPHRGGDCALRCHYSAPGASGALRLGDSWRVRPSDELLRQLGRLLGSDRVKPYYGPRSVTVADSGPRPATRAGGGGRRVAPA
jgi:DNA polymerase-3 subunit alpha